MLLTGPYGTDTLTGTRNVLAIAGGTGISLSLPVALDALGRRSSTGNGLVQLVRVVRRGMDFQWIGPELEELKKLARGSDSGVEIRLFVTRESEPGLRASEDGKRKDDITKVGERRALDLLEAQQGFEVVWLSDCHPKMHDVVTAYIEHVRHDGGGVQVVASGPADMGRDLRAAVALCNDAGAVWRGERSGDVELHWDDGMG